MAELTWQELIDVVKPHIVKIMTPRGSGTGFLLHRSADNSVSAVATAAHVVSTAHFWEEPIRLQHAVSGKSTIFRAANRAVVLNIEKDVAAVAFREDDLGLPEAPLELGTKGMHVRDGVEIGWL